MRMHGHGHYPQRHFEVRGDLNLQQIAAHVLGQPHGVLVVVEANLQAVQGFQRPDFKGCDGLTLALDLLCRKAGLHALYVCVRSGADS